MRSRILAGFLAALISGTALAQQAAPVIILNGSSTVSALNPLPMAGNAFPAGATPITASSGNVANASAVATLAASATKTTYICGALITAAGATVGLVVSPTVSGLVSGTITSTYSAPAGALLGAPVFNQTFSPCIPGSAVNTAIVLTLPALGLGNTNASVSAWGYQQ